MSQTEDSRGAGLAGPADQRPLTEQEFQLVQRIFGDPFSFPISYKTWLISFLESSDLSLPISAVTGLTAILGISGLGGGTLGILPAGLIFPYGGDVAPPGSLLCDGASYSRTTYNRLFNAIGQRFGSVDANSFNVPDIQGRMLVGKGSHASVNAIGKTEAGMSLPNRSPLHTHKLPADGSGNVSTSGGTADGNIVVTDYGPSARTNAEPGKPVDSPAFLTVNLIIVA